MTRSGVQALLPFRKLVEKGNEGDLYREPEISNLFIES
jgi:hypothetical protein